MEVFEITPPTNQDSAALSALIEHAASEAGLIVGLYTTLRAYPGSTHWHFKQPGARGVLELTYWPRQGRLWFAVHANRRAAWIAPAIERLRARIEQDASVHWQKEHQTL
jgi:hypothetical protein